MMGRSRNCFPEKLYDHLRINFRGAKIIKIIENYKCGRLPPIRYNASFTDRPYVTFKYKKVFDKGALLFRSGNFSAVLRGA